MIANAFPYGTTGWSLLEQGEINPETLELDLQGYLIANPAGEALPDLYSWQQAIDKLQALTGVTIER